MLSFLRSLHVDAVSFWLGFLAASLFWGLVRLFWPSLAPRVQKARKQLRSLFDSLRSDITERHRQDTFQYLQRLHLAWPLFSLDEIAIPPRVFPPRIPFDPSGEPYTEDILTEAVPYMPDRPEFASAFGAHELTLDQALSGGTNLVLVAPPGGGKTTALAWLTVAVLRGELQSLPAETIPFFVHAADLTLAAGAESDLLDPIAASVALYSSALSLPRLPAFVRRIFTRGMPLVVLDGCDELPPEALQDVVEYLAALLRAYPHLRFVAAASPHYYDGFTHLQAAILPLKIWGPAEQERFLQTWGTLWQQHIMPQLPETYQPVEPLLLNRWLSKRTTAVSPLEFTLIVWGMYAGDQPAPTLADAMDAYLRRMSGGDEDLVGALEKLARRMVTERQCALQTADEAGSAHIATLLRQGLVQRRAAEAIGLPHPTITAYLAAQAMSPEEIAAAGELAVWPQQDLTLLFLARQEDLGQLAKENIAHPEDPLLRKTCLVSSWVRHIPRHAGWRNGLLKRLSLILSDPAYPLAARARVATDLATTADPAMDALFRRLLNSPDESVRLVAALACGFRQQRECVPELTKALYENPPLCYAAALALVTIDNKPALEALASALLQGSEPTRRAAAEAFANHPAEGHPTLREATTLEDLLVRRAAIYGLRRVRQPWALELLERIQIEDAQWVVKNAAAQAYEELQKPDPHIPRPAPQPAEIPWLVDFAAQRGETLGSGKQAWKTVLNALRGEEQDLQLAAVDLIFLWAYPDVFPAIYTPYLSKDLELQVAAYNALWHLASTGVEIPPPLQYGLG